MSPTHACHLDICDRAVPPKRLFCIQHWVITPHLNQKAIWAAYRNGQEVDKHPSAEYMQAQLAARIAVLEIIRAKGCADPGEGGCDGTCEPCRAMLALDQLTPVRS